MQSLSPCLFLQLGHKQNCLMRFLVALCSWFSEASTRAEAGWFLSFGNRTQNSRVAGARPNHQPIGGSNRGPAGVFFSFFFFASSCVDDVSRTGVCRTKHGQAMLGDARETEKRQPRRRAASATAGGADKHCWYPRRRVARCAAAPRSGPTLLFWSNVLRGRSAGEWERMCALCMRMRACVHVCVYMYVCGL